MLRLAPKDYDLSKPDPLWLRPGDDLVFRVDFGIDVSEWTFSLLYEEHAFSYTPYSYDMLNPGSFEDDFEFHPNEHGVEGAILTFQIDSDIIEDWKDRTLELRLKANNGDRIWIAAERKLTVAGGE